MSIKTTIVCDCQKCESDHDEHQENVTIFGVRVSYPRNKSVQLNVTECTFSNIHYCSGCIERYFPLTSDDIEALRKRFDKKKK